MVYTTDGYPGVAQRVVSNPRSEFAETLADEESQIDTAITQSLSAKEQTVLIDMYGLGGKPKKRIFEIGDGLGLAASSIENIRDDAIKALKLNGDLVERLKKHLVVLDDKS